VHPLVIFSIIICVFLDYSGPSINSPLRAPPKVVNLSKWESIEGGIFILPGENGLL
jgi:hypothetical protein